MISQILTDVLKEIESTLSIADHASGEKLVDRIIRSKRIFVAGAGRSGYIMRAFAMRLMHLGFEVYFVSETNTPSIGREDLLIIGSGSGETESLVVMSKKAKSVGAEIVLVSAFPESSIGALADIVIKIPAPNPKAPRKTGFVSIQPMGNLFEQSMMIYMDAVIIRIMNKKGVDAEEMFRRHANLE